MKTDLGKIAGILIVIWCFFSPITFGMDWLWYISWLIAIVVALILE